MARAGRFRLSRQRWFCGAIAGVVVYVVRWCSDVVAADVVGLKGSLVAAYGVQPRFACGAEIDGVRASDGALLVGVAKWEGGLVF